MVKVRIYIEGGGDSKLQHVQLRKGFHELFTKTGFADRMPGTFAGGGRDKAYSKGRRSFQVLAQLNPSVLKPRLKHFRRLIETLDRLL